MYLSAISPRRVRALRLVSHCLPPTTRAYRNWPIDVTDARKTCPAPTSDYILSVRTAPQCREDFQNKSFNFIWPRGRLNTYT